MSNSNSEPEERRLYEMNVTLPADCQNPEYAIRKLIGEDHGGRVMITHSVVAELTSEQVCKLQQITSVDLQELRSKSAVDVLGFWCPGIMSDCWRMVAKWWQD